MRFLHQRRVGVGCVTGQQHPAFPALNSPLCVTEDQKEDGGAHGHIGIVEEGGRAGDGKDQGRTAQYEENIENTAADHIAHGQVSVAPEGCGGGGALIDKKADKLRIDYGELPAERLREMEDAILQAARVKFTKTEYISCPGCGRTLYNLQETIARIKAATSHLVGLKIGIMGCIVNGPGEMADADYGYVGAGRGKISLYRGKECIEKNIPEQDAVERLLRLIEEDRK